MNAQQAQTAVTTSALVTAGVYAYRKTTEKMTGGSSAKHKHTPKTTAEGVIGTGELLPVGTWVTGAGATFIGLAILATISPDVGGDAAILVAVGCFLGNGLAVIADLEHGLGTEPAIRELREAEAGAEGRPKQTTTGSAPVNNNVKGNHPPAVRLTPSGQLH